VTPRERNLADIGLIALRHGFTRHDLLGKKRSNKLTEARAKCYQMLRDRGLSYPQIGGIFNRHHTTIMYSYPKARADKPCDCSGASAGLI
jgi:chromosomal replication initiation ATPase DnaA